MSKTKNRKEQRVTLPAPWRWLAVLSPNGKMAAVIGLLLGVLGVYYTLAPKLSVVPSETINSKHPFGTLFTIRNESVLEVDSVELACLVRELTYSNNRGLRKVPNPGYIKDLTTRPKLEPSEATTFFAPFPDIVESPLSFADIEILVEYRPLLLPVRIEKRFRFVTVESENGTLRWVSKAISE